MAPAVVDLSLQSMAEPLHRGQLKTVVVTVLAGGELCDRGKPWIGNGKSRIGRRPVWKWRKATQAHSLVAIHLRQIRLVHRARADVLRLQTGGCAELVFNSQAPLHEIRRMQFTIRYCCYRDWWKTSSRICLWRSARKLALGKPQTKSLSCGNGCVDGAVRHSRRDRRAADRRVAACGSGFANAAKQPSVKRLYK